MDTMTLKLDDTLYFSSLNFNGYQNNFLEDTYKSTSEGGKFVIDLARRLNPNRFISRNSSEWTLPWPQEIIPKYGMIDYDPTFNLSFEEVCDIKAADYARRIREYNEKFAIMYSGGIDSTVVMVSLLRVLSAEELKNVSVCTSVGGIIENPNFWKKYIFGKFNVIDSSTTKYDELINKGYTPVTADDGDCIFGTVFGLSVYYNWQAMLDKSEISLDSKKFISNNIHRFSDPSIHYSKFKDLLIFYLNIPPNQRFPMVGQETPNPNFGRLLYDKFDLNCRTAGLPINSLHDFFWWLIFNVKMLNCGVRGALYYNDSIDPNRAIHAIDNWYNDPVYQHWSMNNNNNGQKIGGGPATYKKAARDFIYDFDKNDWYRSFKLKLESMGSNVVHQGVHLDSLNGRPTARFGITKNYDLLSIDSPDVQEYIKYHLDNFKITWSA
jgi:hypothetical protein